MRSWFNLQKFVWRCFDGSDSFPVKSVPAYIRKLSRMSFDVMRARVFNASSGTPEMRQFSIMSL